MTLQEIASKVDGVEHRKGDAATSIATISYDSRSEDDRFLFVALRGERFDGHHFIDSAIENGAAAILVDREFDGDPAIPVLVVEDTRRILGSLGSCFYGHPSRSPIMIGITGTNGKTTSSYLLESILCAANMKVGIIGTIEYRWPGKRIAAANTTPDGLVLHRTLRQMVDDGVEAVVIEVSSHGLANGRVDGVLFDFALFTNLSWDHVDFHGSMKAYREAKWSLFTTYMRRLSSPDERGGAVINIEHPEGQNLAKSLVDKKNVSVATHSTNDVKVQGSVRHFEASDVKVTLGGISMTVDEGEGARFDLTTPLPGRFNAENILGAVAVARSLGIDAEAVTRGLRELGGIPGRMERVGIDEPGPAVFVDFAHSPDALQEALITLRPLTSGELWVVFGCGGDRDRKKRGPMGEVAARLADHVIVTSDNPRSESPEEIIDEIVAGIGGVDEAGVEEDRTGAEHLWHRQVDRQIAIAEAISTAAPTDVVLIAGKGHETYQEQNGHRTDFDDRVESLAALQNRGE